MGLDIFLDIYGMYSSSEIKGEINLTRKGKSLLIPLTDVNYIVLNGIYWRKANHIHRWFVDNIQDGVDDCKEYFVPKEKLYQLLNTCEEIAKGRTDYSELSATSEFFFGSIEYDEGYIEECKRTAAVLKILLKKYPEDKFYYHSSW